MHRRLVDQVINGYVGLDAAYEQARAKKAEEEDLQRRIANLAAL